MKRLFPKALAATALLVVATLSVALVRARLLPSRQPETPPVTDVRIDTVAAAQRLAVAVTYPTIATSADDIATDALRDLHTFLADAYPRVTTSLERVIINEYSLLYTWRGRDSALPPALLLGHLDVVPVAPGTEDRWNHPAFAGVIDQGYVWGRGTLDDKVNVVGLLEAVEALLRDGFEPNRTIMLAFGHDEEVGGEQGAVHIATYLADRKIAPIFVLDEGMAIVAGMLPGLDAPAGLIAIAEKGYVSLELTAQAAGGHSSTPPPMTAVGRLARAIARLQERPMRASISGPMAKLFDHLAPEMPLLSRTVLANRWLFAPILRHQLAGETGTNATLRTTIAPTMIEGGVKANVLPTEARAVINFRIHPNDSIAAVEAHVRQAIDDESIDIGRHGFASEPSPVSPIDQEGYATIARTIREIFPTAIVAPTLTLGGTDARHYAGLSERVYRFTPMVLRGEDLTRIHGTNERIGVEALGNAIAFYYQLIRNASDTAAR